MKLFFKKTAIFLSILAGYMVLMYFTNLLIIEKKSIGWKNCEILIAGDSHTQKALNPKLFHSAVNISQVSEPYYITYWKLKKYLSQHIVDTVLLGFSYHNLSAFNDKKLSDKVWGDEMLRRIYSLETVSLSNDIEINKYELFKIQFKNMYLYPNIDPFYFKGGYSNSNRSNISDSIKASKRHFYNNQSEEKVSKIAAEYLDSIIVLCNKKRIQVVAVTTPMNYSYLNKVPLKFIQAYQSKKESLEKQGIIVLDFGYQKYPDDFYLNSDHVNKKGSEEFTKQILDVLDYRDNHLKNAH
ncbi:MAG: hypothetical protein ABJA35_00245 [Parafilimonas sp.]